MFSNEDKERIVDDVFGLFYKKFGFYPESTGSYYLDAYTINYIKKKYPMVKCRHRDLLGRRREVLPHHE